MMKKMNYRGFPGVFLVVLLCLPTVGEAMKSEIKLTGRKDLILSVESRTTVLEIGSRFLADNDEAFLAGLEGIETPYSFEQPIVEQPGNNIASTPGPVENAVVAPVNYDEASVLKAVAASFAKQVRGSIARGNTSYLQLQGGTLVKPGTSFPARLPQLEGQSFTVTVSEISGNGYLLELGDASLRLDYDNASSGSGRVQFSD